MNLQTALRIYYESGLVNVKKEQEPFGFRPLAALTDKLGMPQKDMLKKSLQARPTSSSFMET